MTNSTFSNLANGVVKKIGKLFTNPYSKIGMSWTNVRVIKNLPDDQLNTIKLFGNDFSFVSRTEFLQGLEEIFIHEIYKQQLSPKPFIIDCGANIGLSIIYLKRLFSDAKIIAFEPDTVNFNLLKKNIESFGYLEVELRKEAVWVEDTTLTFSNAGSMMSKIASDPVAPNSVQVPAIRLKNHMNQPVDFLKIDIEGAEYSVFRDIEDRLDLVNNLFLEYHGTFAQNHELIYMLSALQEKGFLLYIKEAIDKHPTPFLRKPSPDYDVQLNIFCFRKKQ